MVKKYLDLKTVVVIIVAIVGLVIGYETNWFGLGTGSSTAGGAICNNNGVCSGAETYYNCPNDCGASVISGCTPGAVSSAFTSIYDRNNKDTKITSSGITAKIFPSGVSIAEANNPQTAYIDAATNSAGNIDFTNKGVKSCSNYNILLKGARYYCEYNGIKTDKQTEYSTYASIEPTQLFMSQIGTFGTFYAGGWTKSGGVALNSSYQKSSNGILTINVSKCSENNIGLRIQLHIANTVDVSSLKNVVIQSFFDQTSPMSSNAITSATTTPTGGGTNYNIPASILSELRQSFAIPVKADVLASDSGDFFLNLNLDNSTLVAGNKFYIYLDDLSKVNGDDGCGGLGASGKKIEIDIV
ncbi:TPA_asm: hypothetical protein [Altiarchaeum virus]|nr:MAG: hypothetical protein BWK75_01210 [Candidatus Altiarchaeales archaeon A3]DAZ85512.1 TPA_asm: hypothetical protein [Altiarchaeum virus]